MEMVIRFDLDWTSGERLVVNGSRSCVPRDVSVVRVDEASQRHTQEGGSPSGNCFFLRLTWSGLVSNTLETLVHLPIGGGRELRKKNVV